MPISLRISSYQRLTPGQRERFYSTADAFTIGRGKDNDWIMPDPQRFLSGVHCRVERRGDDYFLTDLSTNGTFVNGSDERMARNSAVQINDHDQFRIGDYEFVVELGASTVEVEDDEPLTEGFTAFDAPEGAPVEPFADAGAADDDPFADPFEDAPAEKASPSLESDTDREINTPLSQLDHDALDRGVDIDSILDLDDDAPEEQEPEPGQSGFESINEPMQRPAVSQAPPASDIPDDWDEATGMLRVPDGTDDSDDGFPDDWDVTTGGTPAAESMAEPEREPKAGQEPEAKPAPPVKPLEESAPEPAPEARRASPPPAPDHPEPVPPVPEAAAPAASPAAQTAPATSRAPTAPGTALAAFAAGAKLKTGELNVADEAAFFRFLGEVTHAFGDGLMRALSGRASVKNEFRLDQTMIRPSENNPLKFSPMLDDALHRLLRQNDDHAYLQGADAVQEAFEDINAHQLAVMAGMEAALQGLLKRFSPTTLEKRLVSSSPLDNILPGAKKAKYWDIFNLMYSEIANEAEDDFQQLFGSEFIRAYEAQMSRLKPKKGK